MANVQTENGYGRIANQIMDALAKTHLKPIEARVIWAIFRQTYGWQRKAYDFENGEIANITDLNRKRVYEALNSLKARNMITVTQTRYANKVTICFQKDYSKWEPSRKRGTYRKTGQSVPQNRTKVDATPIIVKKERYAQDSFHFLKKVSIPQNFYLTDTAKQYAISKGITDVEYQFEKFTNHHTSKGTKFKDWIAAWRNWVLNSIKFEKKKNIEPKIPVYM